MRELDDAHQSPGLTDRAERIHCLIHTKALHSAPNLSRSRKEGYSLGKGALPHFYHRPVIIRIRIMGVFFNRS